MVLKLFNTLTRKKQPFQPADGKRVRMYVCGPTVYNYIHIGNARTFLTFDVLKRYLRYKGHEVLHVQNITDVGHLTEDDLAEDKLIRKAKEENVSPLQIAGHYTEAYFRDIERLRIERAAVNPKATEHIDGMVRAIEELIRRGHAYEVNGSVYFDVGSYPEYGKLSRLPQEQLLAGARVEAREEKRAPMDFALWKRAEAGHAMRWPSPWGEGYPGWHIECSVMSAQYLGVPFDLHGGGKDLIFPHHENEIAQAEGQFGKEFARFWLHSEFLLVNGEKMSKSKGNFFTAKEVMDRFTPEATRFFLISAHYRTELNLTDEGLAAARNTVERLQEFIVRLRSVKGTKQGSEMMKLIASAEKGFAEEMDDDLNISAALSHVFDFMREANALIQAGEVSEEDASALLDFLKRLNSVLCVMRFESEQLPAELQALIDEREASRKRKDFSAADQLREELRKRGIILDDTPQGPRWKRG